MGLGLPPVAGVAGDHHRTASVGNRELRHELPVDDARHLQHLARCALFRLVVGDEVHALEIVGADVAVVATHAEALGPVAHDADDLLLVDGGVEELQVHEGVGYLRGGASGSETETQQGE